MSKPVAFRILLVGAMLKAGGDARVFGTQRLSFCEIDRQHSKMIPDSFKFRCAGGVPSEKQFLEHNRVYREANLTGGFGRE